MFATLHTQDAPQSIDRVIDVFPGAPTTAGACSARYVTPSRRYPATDSNQRRKGQGDRGRVVERYSGDPHLIREGKVHQIATAMQAGGVHGMITMDQSLAELVRRSAITYEAAVERCANIEDFERLCGRA